MSAKAVCHICGKPAACFGSYESNANHDFSCDECCGHGNEDGWCTQTFEDLGEYCNGLVKESDVQEEELQKLRAQLAEALTARNTMEQHIVSLRFEVATWPHGEDCAPDDDPPWCECMKVDMLNALGAALLAGGGA